MAWRSHARPRASAVSGCAALRMTTAEIGAGEIYFRRQAPERAFQKQYAPGAVAIENVLRPPHSKAHRRWQTDRVSPCCRPALKAACPDPTAYTLVKQKPQARLRHGPPWPRCGQGAKKTLPPTSARLWPAPPPWRNRLSERRPDQPAPCGSVQYRPASDRA